MAVAQLSPNPRAKGNSSLSIGIGTYSGASAVAAGLFHHVNDMLNKSLLLTRDQVIPTIIAARRTSAVG